MNKKALIPVIIFVSLAVGFWLGRIVYKPSNIFYAQNKSFRQLKELIDIVQENYSDQINVFDFLRKDLTRAISAIDPYSSFFTEDEYKNYENNIYGHYEGIGIQYFLYHDTITIVKVFKNSPAQKAGLSSLDRIITFNNDTVVNVPLDSLSNLFKKTDGKISLGILPYNSDTIKKIKIQKAKINTQEVEGSYIGDSIAYFKINSFSQDADEEFIKIEKKLTSEYKITKIILDLRDNPGGLLSSAVNIADQFFDKGDTIVQTETNTNKRKIYISSDEGLLKNAKIIVLVNGNTASAAELLSLALQDNDRALIIGTQTFGKGVFQQDFSVQNNIAHVTTGKYFGPSGRWINLKNQKSRFYKTKNGRYVNNLRGIIPDIYCNFSNPENIISDYDNALCMFLLDHRTKFSKVNNLKQFNKVFTSIDTSLLPKVIDIQNDSILDYRYLNKIFLEKILFPDSVKLQDFLNLDSCYLKAKEILELNKTEKLIFKADTVGKE